MACPFIPRKLTLCRFGLCQLRTALDTFGVWRKYVRVYADITATLTLLLNTGVVWRWRKDIEQVSFNQLEHVVAHTPVFLHTDVSKPSVIVSHASDLTVGTSLEQMGDEVVRKENGG